MNTHLAVARKSNPIPFPYSHKHRQPMCDSRSTYWTDVLVRICHLCVACVTHTHVSAWQEHCVLNVFHANDTFKVSD